MAYEADRVVIEIIAKTDQLEGPVKQSATTYDQSMNKIVASATKAETAVNKSSGARISAIQKESAQISRFSGIIGTQINDIGGLLQSPKSPFVIVPKEAPKVANAMRLVSVAGGAVGAVLGGVVVAGALAAGAALLALVLKTDGTTAAVNDLVEKLKEHAEKTELNRRAQAIFAETLEGVTEAIRQDEEALKKLNEQHVTAARQALVNAQRRLLTLQGIRDETQANIDLARSELKLAEAQRLRGGDREQRLAGAVIGLGVQKDLDQLETRLGRIDGLIKRQTGRVEEALSHRVVELTKEAGDPVKRINKLYDDQVESVRNLAVTNKTVTSELNKQVAAIEAQRRAALKAEQDRKRTDNSNRQSGRQITEADARAIVAGIGGTVTSGTRSVAHNEKVGGVAGSLHTKGQALDIAKTAGLTLGKIVKAFEAQGVKLIEKLDEGDHFHVAWAKRGGRQGPSAETLARRAEAARIAEENERQAHQNEMAGLNAAEIDARQALIDSAEEIARLELQAIEVSRQKYNDNLLHLQSIGKLQEGEVLERTKINNEIAKLRTELVQRREAERKFRMREEAFRNAQDFQSAVREDEGQLLQGQLDLVRTRKERAEIERRLLDLQFQQERAALQSIINANERLKLEANVLESVRIQAQADATLAQIKLDSLEQRQANAQASGARDAQSPLQSYFGDIQAQADDLNTTFEQIAAGGLATFTDALTNAIVNFTSLGDVGRAVLQALAADLVKLAIQQVILATIGKSMGAAATAATAAQAVAAATAWAPAAAAASLATLGANAGPAAAALASTHALSMALAQAGAAGFAQGGRIFGPGGPTADRVPIMASSDEFMIRASAARRVGYPALEHLNRTGEMPGYAGGGRIRRVSPVNMPASSPRGSGFSSSDISALRGLIGEAVSAGVSAMPDVSLYASLDPADMLQRALGSGPGRKALLAALGANSGAVKATLNR